MKQICSTRLVIGTALLFVSSAAALMAQTEVASNKMPHETLPLVNVPSQTDKGIIGDSLSTVTPSKPVGAPIASTEPSGQTLVVPGTIAKSFAPVVKSGHKSAMSVEPDYLPSWITNQPLAYEKYGAAPAVVTLHFGHN